MSMPGHSSKVVHQFLIGLVRQNGTQDSALTRNAGQVRIQKQRLGQFLDCRVGQFQGQVQRGAHAMEGDSLETTTQYAAIGIFHGWIVRNVSDNVG
jgi:hypothetical protein